MVNAFFGHVLNIFSSGMVDPRSLTMANACDNGVVDGRSFCFSCLMHATVAMVDARSVGMVDALSLTKFDVGGSGVIDAWSML